MEFLFVLVLTFMVICAILVNEGLK